MDDAKTFDLPSHTKNKVSQLWSAPVLATIALILTIWSAANFRPNDQSGLFNGFILLLVALHRNRVAVRWPQHETAFSPVDTKMRLGDVVKMGLVGVILSLRDEAAALRHYVDANLLPPLLHLIQHPDSSHFYYGGDTALILQYMLPLFLLGIFHALWRWRVAGVLILVLPQPLYYFRDHLPLYSVQIRPYYDHIDAFDRGRLPPPNTTLIFVSDDAVYTDHFTTLSAFWRFNPLVVVLKAAELTPDYLASLPSGGYGFFVDPNNAVAPMLLRSYFDTLEAPQSSPYNVPLKRQYVLYYLPPRSS